MSIDSLFYLEVVFIKSLNKAFSSFFWTYFDEPFFQQIPSINIGFT